MRQGSTTATIRGTVQDPSGGVLPGATVTATNTGTKGVQTAVSDDRGQYLFAGLFPGTYDLKVELSGFKTYEQKGLSLSPSDNRGIDVRLEIGSQTETVTVTSQLEVIQTETGAREGVLTAKQIDNLSIIGRSALELMRILPGVVTEFNVGESVSFGGGGNNTQGYTVNGIRSSGNTVSLDGSSLIDIGSNSGVIVSPEQRHDSGSQGAELELRGRIRHRRHERQRRHQVRAVRSSTARSTTTGATTGSPPTTARTASPAPRSPRAPISIRAATSAARSCSATATPRTATGCSSSSPMKRSGRRWTPGSHFTRTFSQAMRNGDYSELLANRGSNLNSIPQLRIPKGAPDAGAAGPEQQPAPRT